MQREGIKYSPNGQRWRDSDCFWSKSRPICQHFGGWLSDFKHIFQVCCVCGWKPLLPCVLSEWWVSLCPKIFSLAAGCSAVWPEQRLMIFNSKHYGEPETYRKLYIETRKYKNINLYLMCVCLRKRPEEQRKRRKGEKEETGGQTHFINTCTWRLPHLLQMLERGLSHWPFPT